VLNLVGIWTTAQRLLLRLLLLLLVLGRWRATSALRAVLSGDVAGGADYCCNRAS